MRYRLPYLNNLEDVEKYIEVSCCNVSNLSQTGLGDAARSNGDWMPTTMDLEQQTMKK